MESVGGMTMYTGGLEQMLKSADVFNRQTSSLKTLDDRISDLETILSGMSSIDTLNGRVSWLYNLYEDIDLTDVETIIDAIYENSQKVKAILKGDSDVILPYDTSVLQSGEGINIVRDENTGKADVIMDRSYTMIDSTDSDSDPATYFVDLVPGKNFLTVDMSSNADSDAVPIIDINDTANPWEIGQSFSIYMIGDFSGGMVITTGSNTIILESDELKGKTIAEIICIGTDKFIHLIR